MIERIGIVFRKEVTDNLRDRRTLVGAVFYPLLGPLLMMLLFTVLARTFSERTEKPLKIPVAGAEHAPSLIQFLKQNNVEIQPALADPEGEVRAGNYDVVIMIPEGYGKDFTAGQPATVQLVLDDSRQSASVSIQRTRNLLGNYSRQIGALRLLARGVNPNVGEALAIENLDVSTPQSQAASFLNIMPYFMIFSVFIGGTGVAIDATAGERERGSLEPLVINPIARWELLLGKLGATLPFTLFAVAETLIGFAVMLNYVPLEELGVKVSLSALTLLGVFGITLPMMLLAAALQIIVATFTRSFKEAQNYLSLLPLVPALPGMFLAFVPVKPELWTMLIPTFGQQLLINQLMRGEHPGTLNLIVSAALTLAVGIALTFVAIKIYEREQVLFGR